MSILNAINEEKRAEKLEQLAEKHEQHVDLFERSPLAKAKKQLGNSDYEYLFHQLEMAETYTKVLESYGRMSDLGPVKPILLDLVTTVVGTNMLPMIASVQPIDEPDGTIFYEKIIANDTRGNVATGDVLENAMGMPGKHQVGYASEKTNNITAGRTAAGDTEFDIVLPGPIRPGTVKIRINELDVVGEDDRKGRLLGYGLYGEIDYETGNTSIKLVQDPGAEYDIKVDFAKDFESSDIPSISSKQDVMTVSADVFALKSEMSMIAAFIQSKRWGTDANADTIVRLQEEINKELLNSAIGKIEAAAKMHGTKTTFDARRPDGVGLTEHLKGLKYHLGKANNAIQNQSGKSGLGAIVGGTEFCNILETVPGFVPSGQTGSGATFHGTLDGRTAVLRAPQLGNANAAYPMYKGNAKFDTPLVYAPFMPLVVKKDIPGKNALLSENAVASMAAVEVVSDRYITEFEVIQ